MNNVKLNMFFTFIILLGGVNYLLLAYKNDMFEPFGKWKNVVYIFIALASLYNVRMTTFLPFLGETAFPIGVLYPTKPKNANIEYNLTDITPNSYVVYWAAENKFNEEIINPKNAYGEYTNAGVAISDNDGKAKLLLKCPSRYYVGRSKMPKHIHYRYVLKNGLLSKVYTKNIYCN